jgi:hypothetical protein
MQGNGVETPCGSRGTTHFSLRLCHRMQPRRTLHGRAHGSTGTGTPGSVHAMTLPCLSLPSAPSADLTDRLVDYLVDTPEGPVGVLDGFERDERGQPASLIVSQGWFGRRRLLVPIEQLAKIDHARKCIILTPGAAPIERKGPIARLIDRGESPCHEDDSEGADEVGWRPVLRETVDGKPTSEAANIDGEPIATDEQSLCPACGRSTRTTPRGACADCWQRKLPDGEAVLRPLPARTSSLLGTGWWLPDWVAVATIAAIVAGLLAGIALAR